jgi:glycosyltransferase involved in cell wall biosynthesis
MKICLVTEYFYPKGKGGTEKYVFELAKRLVEEHHQVFILTADEENVEYVYENISVKTVLLENSVTKSIISGRESSSNISEFKQILVDEKPALVHFHTFTPSFNIFHFRIAKSLGCQLNFTVHVPSITCIHGDLMQFGTKACDGKILENRCLACYISKKKIPKTVSSLAASLILQFSYPQTLANVVKQKLQDIQEITELCELIYIFTSWQKEVFLKNGVPESKLVLTQQMKVRLPDKDEFNFKSKSTEKIKLGFVGRITPEKGINVLIDAFNKSHSKLLELHIVGILEDETEQYFQDLLGKSKDNPNIFWTFNLTQSNIAQFYKSIDILCIPSVWYETGPFVLYEAISHHLPVIANDLGDMGLWKTKGYNITLYRTPLELRKLLKNIRNNDC